MAMTSIKGLKTPSGSGGMKTPPKFGKLTRVTKRMTRKAKGVSVRTPVPVTKPNKPGLWM